jgi:hypothetical protein
MAQEELKIEDFSGRIEGHRVIRLIGPLVLSNFFEFQSLVRANTSSSLILGAYVNHQRDGRSLLLVGVTKRVRDALHVTRVEQFFKFHDSLGSAEGGAA